MKGDERRRDEVLADASGEALTAPRGGTESFWGPSEIASGGLVTSGGASSRRQWRNLDLGVILGGLGRVCPAGFGALKGPAETTKNKQNA